jgi:AraC-like DNA-binding protein
VIPGGAPEHAPPAGRQRGSTMHAIKLLSTGKTVTQTAATLGYGTPAAFTTMFSKHIAATPTSFQSLQTPR